MYEVFDLQKSIVQLWSTTRIYEAMVALEDLRLPMCLLHVSLPPKNRVAMNTQWPGIHLLYPSGILRESKGEGVISRKSMLNWQEIQTLIRRRT